MLNIVYPSSVYYWTNGDGRKYPRMPFNRISFSPDRADSQGDTLDLPKPVSIMLHQRKGNSEYNYVPEYAHLPENSFVQIADNVAVASPELCFLEAARYLPFDYLVELGNCLCAGYVIDSSSQYGQRKRTPVTSSAKIISFLKKAKGCYGIKKALRAAKYICDNSFSPIESRIAVIFFIPRHDGGYGIIRGELNGPLILPQDDLDYLHAKSCCADILWELQKVAFEYDSTMTHTSEDQRRYDAMRQTVMNHSGYKIVRWTPEQMLNFSTFDKATLILWSDLNMKGREKDLMKYHEVRRDTFMHLFKTEHSFFPM